MPIRRQQSSATGVTTRPRHSHDAPDFLLNTWVDKKMESSFLEMVCSSSTQSLGSNCTPIIPKIMWSAFDGRNSSLVPKGASEISRDSAVSLPWPGPKRFSPEGVKVVSRMLNVHRQSTFAVLKRWSNINKEETRLLSDAQDQEGAYSGGTTLSDGLIMNVSDQ